MSPRRLSEDCCQTGTMVIQHIAFGQDWHHARRTGTYDRSTRGASIEEVGFLHASDGPEQVSAVLARFYADVREPLVLLTLDEAALAAAGLSVVWEPGDPADPDSERFPHVYGGPLPVAAVSRVEPVVRSEGGLAPDAAGGSDDAVAADVDALHLSRAIALAGANAATDGGPFGALVVTADGRTFEGANRVTATNDPTAHAEVTAIRAACSGMDTFDLSGAVMYASCEPCPMCLGAALWARVGRVVYAADRHDAAAAGFDDAAFYDYLESPDRDGLMPLVHRAIPEAAAPFEAWRANADRTEY
jgi:guanine deaminase